MTGVAVAVAGIGIGASTATFSVLDAVLLRPLPYPEADRLVQITQKTTPPGVAAGRPLRDDLPINAQDFLVYEAETASFSNWAWTAAYEPNRDATVGGGRARLFRLLMAESLILAALGGMLGLLLAHWGTAALIALVPAELTRAGDAGLDGRVLSFALAISIATGMIFRLIPALRSSDVDLMHDLKSGGRLGAGVGSSTLSRSLIAGQVALTLVLLMGGGLLGKSFLRLKTDDRGYDPDNILTVTVTPGYLHRFARIDWFDLESRRTRSYGPKKAVRLPTASYPIKSTNSTDPARWRSSGTGSWTEATRSATSRRSWA